MRTRAGPRAEEWPGAFLELVLSDEVTRRDPRSAMLRARTAGLDPTMRLDTWEEPPDLRYDRALLSDLASLPFTEHGNGVLIPGPVTVGMTHMAAALRHIAVRRRRGVHSTRADRLFARLRAARLDSTLEAEVRRLTHIELRVLAMAEFCDGDMRIGPLRPEDPPP